MCIYITRIIVSVNDTEENIVDEKEENAGQFKITKSRFFHDLWTQGPYSPTIL